MPKRRPITYLAVAVAALLIVRELPRAAQTPPGNAPVTFRIIVVSSVDRAETVVNRLRAGGDFVSIAQAESIDPSASRGGLIGPVEPSALRPELRDALANLAAGQISGIVQVPFGFAVL